MEKHQKHDIYFAAPDFSYGDRRAIDRALELLAYHHLNVRRPILENGEIAKGAGGAVFQEIFDADYQLLKECALVFAVPTGRDPGTLVEIGIAIECKIPVVVFDAALENRNPMVVAGARHYSDNLQSCVDVTVRLLGLASQV